MREIRFILPYLGGTSLNAETDPGHRLVEQLLLDSFGGFTTQHARGCWLDKGGHRHDGQSLVYTIAINSSTRDELLRNTELLLDIATKGAKANRQSTLYFVHVDGHADIIDALT